MTNRVCLKCWRNLLVKHVGVKEVLKGSQSIGTGAGHGICGKGELDKTNTKGKHRYHNCVFLNSALSTSAFCIRRFRWHIRLPTSVPTTVNCSSELESQSCKSWARRLHWQVVSRDVERRRSRGDLRVRGDVTVRHVVLDFQLSMFCPWKYNL